MFLDISTAMARFHKKDQERMWTNPGEIPDNGIDDDGDSLAEKVVAGNVASWEWWNGSWMGHQRTWWFIRENSWVTDSSGNRCFFLHPDPWLTGNLFLCIVHIYQPSGGLKKNTFYFHPKNWGNDPIWLYNIFQRLWNHQPWLVCSFFCVLLRRRIWAFFGILGSWRIDAPQWRNSPSTVQGTNMYLSMAPFCWWFSFSQGGIWICSLEGTLL